MSIIRCKQSTQQRKLEQLYYIAGVNYSKSRPQKYTSNVKNYDYNALKKIVGRNKADDFYKKVNVQSKKHKVDLSHLSITVASALDPDKKVQVSHLIATFPDQVRETLFMMLTGKSLTNERKLPKNIEQWIYANGFYGDYVVDGDMSKEDRNADLDAYRVATSKGDLAKALKDIYNSDESDLNKERNNQEKGMKERSKLTVITSQAILATMGFATAGLLAWRNSRALKQSAKMAVQAVMHPSKTIKKVVQKTKTVFSRAKKQVTSSKVYRATKQFVTHPIKTVKNFYRKTVNVVKRGYQKYTPKPIKRFNNHIKQTIAKKYNSARKSASRFVKKVKTKIKKFFRRKR